MSSYQDRIPKSIKASTEGRLEQALLNLQVAMDQKLEIINIYQSVNGGVVCWYFQDIGKLGVKSVIVTEEEAAQPNPVPIKKKATRRRKG